jgi:hypothetical protein
MTEAKLYDASDEDAVSQRRKASKRREDERLDALKAIMSHANGRSYVWLHTPSTNLGIAGILTAIAGFLTGATDAHTAVMLALGSAVSILLPEKKA